MQGALQRGPLGGSGLRDVIGVFEGAGIGMAVVHQDDGAVLAANPALAAMLGRDREALAGRSFVELTHPDDVDLDLALYRELLDGERETYRVEKRYLRGDGTVLHGQLTVTRFPLAGPRAVLGMVEDVTERHCAQQRLREQQEELQRLVAAQQAIATAPSALDVLLPVVAEQVRLLTGAPGVVVVLSEDDGLVCRGTAGTAGPHLGLRLSPHGLSGRCIADGRPLVCVDADVDPRVDVGARVLTGTRSTVMVPLCWGERAVGVLALTSVRPAAFGAPDVRRLELLSDLVAAKVGKALAFAENARLLVQLEAARAAAEAASAAKTAFVATTSHEIRTPMNGVLGAVQLLRRTDLDPVQRELVEVVARSGEALLALVDDVLDLTKVESGALELELAPLEVRPLVAEVADLWRPRVEGRGLVLTVDVAPDVPAWVVGDRSRLRQVLSNWTSNAAKFTERGGVHLSAGVRGDVLRLAVTDTGPGLSDEEQAQLFRPFTQLPGTARRHGGSGLGLAITRELAGLLGGRVDVHSAPGRGSTFWLEVPLEPAAAPAPDLVPAPAGVLDGDRSRRVLVVDDVQVNRMVAEGLLRSLGHEVEVAEDGRDALDALLAPGRGRFDLVLMDCQMPVLDGFAATRLLREHEERTGLPRLRVVALTASALTEDRAACLEAGMDGYLTKPLVLERLAEVLAAV